MSVHHFRMKDNDEAARELSGLGEYFRPHFSKKESICHPANAFKNQA